MDNVMRADKFVDEGEEFSDKSKLSTERKFKIHEEINVKELMSEFEKLFHNKNFSENNNNNRNFRKSIFRVELSETEEENEINRNYLVLNSLPSITNANTNTKKSKDKEIK
jgi:hypothetical protein